MWQKACSMSRWPSIFMAYATRYQLGVCRLGTEHYKNNPPSHGSKPQCPALGAMSHPDSVQGVPSPGVQKPVVSYIH